MSCMIGNQGRRNTLTRLALGLGLIRMTEYKIASRAVLVIDA